MMKEKNQYYIYILRCEGNSLYTGIARDWKRRYTEHLEGKGAKYTKSHVPQSIESVWEVVGRSDASKVELLIKSYTKKDKESFITDKEKLIREVFEKLQIEIKKSSLIL